MVKKCSRRRSYGFTVLLLLAAWVPALAQHTSDGLGGGAFNNAAGQAISKTIIVRITQSNQVRRPAARRTGPGSTVRRPSESRSPVAKLNESSVLFRPTGTHLKTREIANLIDAGNPQVLKLATVLLEEFEKGASAAGHPNDLALALSFFLATNASVYHDGGQPADPPMVELRDTIAEALVEGHALNGVTDRQKQEMYETLVIFTGFALATYQEGKQGGSVDTVRVGRQLAGQNLQALVGISPDKITFTDQAGLNIETEPAAAIATATPSSPQPTIPPESPSEVVNAGKLVIDFEGNEVRANQMYGGKRVRVNGRVNSIEVQKNGLIVLTFHSPAGGYAQTQCYFNQSQSSRLAQLSGGQEALVEGTVRGISGGLGGKGFVVLEDCIVP